MNLDPAEVQRRLSLVREKGTDGAAAELGVSRRSIQRTVATYSKEKLAVKAAPPRDLVDDLRARISGLEADLASIRRENVDARTIRSTIYDLAETTPAPPDWIDQPVLKLHGSTYSVPMVMWSDWHWGEVVRPSEVKGTNEFNRAIAKARLSRLVQSTVDLARRHMGDMFYPGIVVILGGDMLSGNIHEELAETNEGSVNQCFIELQDLLCWALSRMADEFGKVFVPCVVGNHGRTTKKPRAKSKVFENWEWNLYCQLERYFRADPRVQFAIPEGPDVLFSVLGHRFLLTHGDCLGVKGGDGLIGALGPITRGVIKIGRSNARIGQDFDTLLIGHYHMYTPRGDGCAAIVNGTLKGFDEFAHTILRVPASRPSQALWFVHARHGITAQWPVFLDERKELELPDDHWVRVWQ